MLPSEVGEFADEVRHIFHELGRTSGEMLTGECTPPVDVYETDDLIEIAADVPGVDAAAVRIVIKRDVVLIAGVKLPRRSGAESTFHLVERGFGRFARVVRFGRACDASKARARLAGGELTISVPKLGERRGQAFRVAITAVQDAEGRVQ